MPDHLEWVLNYQLSDYKEVIHLYFSNYQQCQRVMLEILIKLPVTILECIPMVSK